MGNYDSWRKALELPYASLADSYDLYGDELRAFRGRRFRVADPTGDNISRPPPPGYCPSSAVLPRAVERCRQRAKFAIRQACF